MPQSPTDEASPDEPQTGQSGGVNLAVPRGDVTIGGDAVGRDKVTTAGGHIIHVEAGATVIIGDNNSPRPVSNQGPLPLALHAKLASGQASERVDAVRER